MGTKNHVNPRSLFKNRLAVFLSQAATDSDLHARIFFFLSEQHSEIAIKLVVCVFTHRTGVKHDDV